MNEQVLIDGLTSIDSSSKLGTLNSYAYDLGMLKGTTVDGRNPAPLGMYKTL